VWTAGHEKTCGTFPFPWDNRSWKNRIGESLSRILFDDENAMTRIDMSEYQERHSVSSRLWERLRVKEEGGQLTEAVRRKPYSVILDEIEKAHPDTLISTTSTG
jgi:ATP-dependent Clp protease ATP-binding subunit ClpB